MYALALPDGQMYAPKVKTALSRCPEQAAKWKTPERAKVALDKANAQRTQSQPKFELVTVYVEADICAA